MDELEHKLKQARLAAPSAELDRRIGAAFATARRRRETSRRPEFWWWVAALATAGGMAALLVVSAHRPLPASAVAVYHVEAEGRLREMLLDSSAPQDVLPRFVVHEGRP
jgi:hypothetical protein